MVFPHRRRVVATATRCLLLSFGLLLIFQTAQAAVGGMADAAFSPAIENSLANHSVRAIALQPDGKAIIAGEFSVVNGTSRNSIARLNSDGTLDTSFNSGFGTDWPVAALALQSDGKIIIGGDFTVVNGVGRPRIARLNPDGSLDHSFTPGTGANYRILSIAPQADGKIVIGGYFTSINSVSCNYLARLNSDGSLDSSFNSGTGANNVVTSLALQTDGKIIVGGYFFLFNGVAHDKLARLNSDGSLDSSFNPSADGAVQVVAIQPNGKIVIGGSFYNVSGSSRHRVARLNGDGSLDNSFNPVSDAGATVLSLAVQTSGKIVIGGDFSTVGRVSRSRVAQLNSDGSLDTSFVPASGADDNKVNAVAAQADGKVIIGGEFSGINGVLRRKIGRLNSDGSLDASYKSGVAAGGQVLALAVQPDGKVVIGGFFTAVNGVERQFIARLNRDGSLDNSFNTVPGLDSTVRALAIQSDGKIVIGGSFIFVNGVRRNYIARLNADGSLDASFESVLEPVGPVFSVVVQPDGKIIVGGAFYNVRGASRNRIARLNADGSIDTSFNPGSGATSTVYAVAVQPDNKVIIVGDFSFFNGVTRNRIARLNPDGSLDTSFDPGVGPNFSVRALGVEANGKMVIGGDFTTIAGVSRNHVARLNPNGSLDTSFQPGSGANSAVRALAVLDSGRIIIGGEFATLNGVSRSRIARLNNNGSLDTRFNPLIDQPVFAIFLQPDGKLLVGGRLTAINGAPHAGLTRLLPDRAEVGDFDGDGRTEVAVWQSDSGKWHLINSSYHTTRLQFWGQSSLGDIGVPGDYDGDGRVDIAIYRPAEGNWYILQSSTGAGTIQGWGAIGDRPVPADYDGDNVTDAAVYRPSEGNWYIRQSTGGVMVQGWGDPTDKLVPGDYDGDGRADIAVWRPSDGNWYILQSSGGLKQQQWGLSEDQPVLGDYDADGKTDIAVFRPSEGNWYIIRSNDGVLIRNWGDSTDRPVPGDYDGDGKTDIAVWRPAEGTWYIIQSATDTGAQRYLGSSTDTPIPAAYLPQ